MTDIVTPISSSTSNDGHVCWYARPELYSLITLLSGVGVTIVGAITANPVLITVGVALLPVAGGVLTASRSGPVNGSK